MARTDISNRTAATHGTERLRRIAFVLDDLFRIPGTRFRVGLDALLGLIPGGGDVAGAIVSAYTLLAAARVGAPTSVILRLAGNILLDTVVGAVPLLGDLFDAGWKANRRNVALLERFLEAPEPVHKASRSIVALVLFGLLLLIIALAVVSVLFITWLVERT